MLAGGVAVLAGGVAGLAGGVAVLAGGVAVWLGVPPVAGVVCATAQLAQPNTTDSMSNLVFNIFRILRVCGCPILNRDQEFLITLVK